jgi:hypothetical protein
MQLISKWHSLTWILLFLCWTQCKDSNRAELIIGSWTVDSVYTFYNGFNFTQHDMSLEPGLNFMPDGWGHFARNDEQRPFTFKLSAPVDSLFLMTDNGKEIATFKILKLDGKTLVLRQEKRTLFTASNQRRFEIRYLSKKNFN